MISATLITPSMFEDSQASTKLAFLGQNRNMDGVHMSLLNQTHSPASGLEPALMQRQSLPKWVRQTVTRIFDAEAVIRLTDCSANRNQVLRP